MSLTAAVADVTRALARKVLAASPVRRNTALQQTRRGSQYVDRTIWKNDRASRLSSELDPWAANAGGNAAFQSLIAYELATVIGTGVIPSCSTGNPATDALVNALWKSWSRTADVSGRGWLNFQNDVVTALACDGEIHTLLTNEGQLQLLTAPLCREIQIDALGRPVRYVFGDGGTFEQTKDAGDVLSVIDRAHPRDIRGTSRYLGALKLTDYEARFSATELASAIVFARAAFYIKRTADGAPHQPIEAGEFDQQPDGSRAREVSLGTEPLIADNLAPGEEIEVVSPNGRPTEWKDTRQGVLATAAAAVGADAGVTSGMPQSNYSASRSLRTASDRQMEARYELLVQSLWEPIWRWRLNAWAQQGLISAQVALTADPQFQFNPLPPIDPGKRAAADKTRLETGVASRRQVLREQGTDADRIIREVDADSFQTRPRT